MSMHDAFMADIVANPDDDTPRLVYADWLEDNGDPERAAFIRAQCRLAAMGRYELERYDLEGELDALLKKNARRWLKPLAKITSNVEFRRGFPHRFALPAAKFVEKGEEVFSAAPTLCEYRVLKPKEAWDEMLACPALEKVTSFDAGHQPGITIPRVQALAGAKRLRNLRDLNLSDTALGRCITELAGSPHLGRVEKLNVSGCGLAGRALDTFLNASSLAKNLSSLDISGNGFKDSNIYHLRRWKGTGRLESLNVGEGDLGDDAALIFAAGDWPALRKLVLFFHQMGTEGLNALGECKSLSGLRSLNLHHLPGQDMAGLLTSPHLAGLEELRLNASADLLPLADAPMLSSLRSLYAHPNSSMLPVLSSPASAGLRELSLRGMRNGLALAEQIAEATHLTGLRRLSLGDISMNEAGVRHLAGAAHLAGLVTLELSATMGEAGAKALIGSPHLNRLRRLAVGAIFGPPFEALQERFGADVVVR
jgi:uncharacterized protein (TIGR02996 family)